MSNSSLKTSSPVRVQSAIDKPNFEAYMDISKEELINELILVKANELRSKKGYEVKGVGANKEYVSLSNKSTKS